MKKVKFKAPSGDPTKTDQKHANLSVDGVEWDSGVSLKLLGRVILGRNSKAKDKLLYCKMYTYVASFNARTLKSKNKKKNLYLWKSVSLNSWYYWF